MVRSRKRKTTRGETPPDVMLSAVKEALEGKLSVRAVGHKYDIDHATLLRYCNKYKSARLQSTSSDEADVPQNFVVGYSKPMKVFMEEEEKLLEDYLKKAAALYYGLNPTEVRILAHQFAVKNNKFHLILRNC